MEQSQSADQSRGIYWILFFVSLIIQILLVLYLMEFFWVALPFVLGFLVKALGKM